jgi:hypothetical protein
MRARGYSLEQIGAAGESGRLVSSYKQTLLPAPAATHTREDAFVQTGLEPALSERILTTLGLPAQADRRLTTSELELLRYSAAALGAGFPLVAFLQLVRVYGQALAQIADAEVRLFHLYVHEPLMRDGVPGAELSEEMRDLVADVLALATRSWTSSTSACWRTSSTRTSSATWRPSSTATAISTSATCASVGQPSLDVRAQTTRPLPRIGYSGEVVYRDCDYFGREVNQAARVSARSAAGEVLVTRPVVEAAGGASCSSASARCA